MSIKSAQFGCAVCWTLFFGGASMQISLHLKLPQRNIVAVMWLMCTTHQNWSRNDSKNRVYYKEAKELSGIHFQIYAMLQYAGRLSCRGRKERHRGEKRLWFEMWLIVKGWERILKVRAERNPLRGMQRATDDPVETLGLLLHSGNMTVSDAPDGRTGKSVKKKKKNHKCGYRVWALEKPLCVCILYLPVLSLHTKAKLQPRPALNLTLPCLWKPAGRNYSDGETLNERKRKRSPPNKTLNLLNILFLDLIKCNYM